MSRAEAAWAAYLDAMAEWQIHHGYDRRMEAERALDVWFALCERGLDSTRKMLGMD